MKNLYIVIISIFLLSSCGDSFLESDPTTEIPEDKYYTTEARILSGLMAAYGPLQWPDWAFSQYNPLEFVSDVMSDDVRVGGSNANDNEHLQRMRFFNATPNYVCDGLWTVFYSGINRANIVINRMDNVQNISEASKNRILAEAHVLRAYYYSWLWKLWGNIPYYEVNPASPPYLVEQIKADEVYANIIKDLDYALADNKLPNSVSTDQLGRFTRAAAQMLKTNVVMYQNDQTKFAESLVDMKEIISSGQYKLLDDFGQIWEDTGEWSSESIFEVNYSDESSVRGWSNALGVGGSVYPTLIGINNLKDNTFAGGWGFEPVEESLYNLYESTDQRQDGGILNFAKLKISNPSASYDPRYDNTGFFNKKYLPRIGGNSKCPGDKDLNYRNNYRVYRYSETLLIAAELTIRTGGSQADADNYLNQVRARAYKMNITDTAFDLKKKTATLDNLLFENRLEFACEGHRFWDLVRFGKAQEILGSRGYSQNKKYLPIPQGEIDKAQGTLTQNPY